MLQRQNVYRSGSCSARKSNCNEKKPVPPAEKKNVKFIHTHVDSDFEMLLSTEVHLMNSDMIFLNADDVQA